ncbi:hypothetical protein [Pseudomonas syringae]|uniref:hypothetical protein n=1 Tax=Pseudomonas syringae TaxID=317 RepID=UPI003F581717
MFKPHGSARGRPTSHQGQDFVAITSIDGEREILLVDLFVGTIGDDRLGGFVQLVTQIGVFFPNADTSAFFKVVVASTV